tara:strand:- start:727 stop:903 length:177 start_codon:yes stop_codon:yes gene_type:complete
MNALKFLGLEEKIVVKEIQKRGSSLPPTRITVKDVREGMVRDTSGQLCEVVVFLRKAK